MAVSVLLFVTGSYYSCSNNVNSEIASLNFVKRIPMEEMDKININMIIIIQQAYTACINCYTVFLVAAVLNIDEPDQRLVWSHEGSCRDINIAPRLYKRKFHCIHNNCLPSGYFT